MTARSIATRIEALTDPRTRLESARILAQELGVDDLLIFVFDPESNAMLPAPGFPQTLPDGRRWSGFLNECRRSGFHRESLPAPPEGTIARILGISEGEAVAALVGGYPREADCAELRDRLPLLAAALRNERAAEAAFLHAKVAHTSAAEARAMTMALDRARRELQRALAEVQRMKSELEEALKVRDDFVSVASHELRNPVNALQLQVMTLLRAAAARPETVNGEFVTSRLDAARRQVDRLVRLVDQLLDVSRLTAAGLDLDLAETDFAAVTREATARIGVVQKEPPIALSAPESLLGVSDPMRLDQVVTNLVSNALKYGDGKPVIVELESRDGMALLRVTDGGIGIPKESQERIFERFERAVPERRYRGLGLGLWITREIVDVLGGRISVESAPGQGSTFTVTLPLDGPARTTRVVPVAGEA